MAEGKVCRSLRNAQGGKNHEYLFETDKSTHKCYKGNRRCDETREKIWMVSEVCQFSQGVWPTIRWSGEHTADDRTRMVSIGKVVQ